MPTVGTKVRWAMERGNMSKMTLSVHTGITTYNLAKIMNDSLQPGKGEIKKLCRALGIDEGELT